MQIPIRDKPWLPPSPSPSSLRSSSELTQTIRTQNRQVYDQLESKRRTICVRIAHEWEQLDEFIFALQSISVEHAASFHRALKLISLVQMNSIVDLRSEVELDLLYIITADAAHTAMHNNNATVTESSVVEAATPAASSIVHNYRSSLQLLRDSKLSCDISASRCSMLSSTCQTYALFVLICTKQPSLVALPSSLTDLSLSGVERCRFLRMRRRMAEKGRRQCLGDGNRDNTRSNEYHAIASSALDSQLRHT